MGVITECLMVLLLCQAIGFMRADDTQVDQPVQPGVGGGEGEQISIFKRYCPESAILEPPKPMWGYRSCKCNMNLEKTGGTWNCEGYGKGKRRPGEYADNVKRDKEVASPYYVEDEEAADMRVKRFLTCYNSEGEMVHDGEDGVIDNKSGCWECPCVDGQWPATEDVKKKCTKCTSKKSKRALEEEFTDDEMAALQLLENVDKRGKKKGGCSKPSTKATADLKKFNKLLLEWHNYYRCLHGVKNLGYSRTLEQGSKRNVDMNIRQGGMDHTQGNSYGENLFAAWSSGGMKQTSAQKVVKAWYDEISMYNFNNPGFGYNTGHFTQVVWKNTKKVGCYAREIPDQRMKKVFVACQYDPAGNMDVWGPPAKNTKNWKDQVPRPK